MSIWKRTLYSNRHRLFNADQCTKSWQNVSSGPAFYCMYFSFLQEEQQFWQWNTNQPGDMTGDCGAGTYPSLPQNPAIGATIDPRSGTLSQPAAVTQTNLLAVSLGACSEELPFICVNKGFEVSVAKGASTGFFKTGIETMHSRNTKKHVYPALGYPGPKSCTSLKLLFSSSSRVFFL